MAESRRESDSWILKVRSTYNYHTEKLRQNPKWCIRDTARSLSRSVGAISQDITLASWLFTHKDELERFEYMKDALHYVREKQSVIRKRPLDGI